MPVPVDRLSVRDRIDAARVELKANLKRLQESRSRLAATRHEVAGARLERERLHESAFARLQAKLESLPVIEQAKGILIAESGCQPEEAFDILRRASQRMNVKVRELAAEIVQRAAAGERPAARESRGLRCQGVRRATRRVNPGPASRLIAYRRILFPPR